MRFLAHYGAKLHTHRPLNGQNIEGSRYLGRNELTGKRIVAQCKKDSPPVSIDKDFVSCLAPDDDGYYFAYGGCTSGLLGRRIRIIDRSFAREWAETEKGSLFQRLFLGGGARRQAAAVAASAHAREDQAFIDAI